MTASRLTADELTQIRERDAIDWNMASMTSGELIWMRNDRRALLNHIDALQHRASAGLGIVGDLNEQIAALDNLRAAWLPESNMTLDAIVENLRRLALSAPSSEVVGGPFYVGAQNDCLFIIEGERPALSNDYPRHDANRNVVATIHGYRPEIANAIVTALNRSSSPAAGVGCESVCELCGDTFKCDEPALRPVCPDCAPQQGTDAT